MTGSGRWMVLVTFLLWTVCGALGAVITSYSIHYTKLYDLLSAEEARETLVALQKTLVEKNQERARQAAEKNRTEGEAFLAGNKTMEGVVSLPSGLQYKVLRSGDGPSPKGTDTVETNYRGTLVDGTEFDSSYNFV